jgi:hypothetical protein
VPKGASTIVEDPLQIGRNMQNKAKVKIGKMNLKIYNITDYENISDWTLGENKPKQSQFQNPRADSIFELE